MLGLLSSSTPGMAGTRGTDQETIEIKVTQSLLEGVTRSTEVLSQVESLGMVGLVHREHRRLEVHSEIYLAACLGRTLRAPSHATEEITDFCSWHVLTSSSGSYQMPL
jgi:hypothetical protein